VEPLTRGEFVGQMTRERLAGQIAMLKEIGEIPETYPVERLASFDFAPSAPGR
jgi:hypothetical protein